MILKILNLLFMMKKIVKQTLENNLKKFNLKKFMDKLAEFNNSLKQIQCDMYNPQEKYQQWKKQMKIRQESLLVFQSLIKNVVNKI